MGTRAKLFPWWLERISIDRNPCRVGKGALLHLRPKGKKEGNDIRRCR